MSYTVDKITGRNAIIEAGVMMTPALMIGGTVRSSGKVLTLEQRAARVANL